MTATNKHIPGKRIKTWHRKHNANAVNESARTSLLRFARIILAQPPGDSRTEMERVTAQRWLANRKAA